MGHRFEEKSSLQKTIPALTSFTCGEHQRPKGFAEEKGESLACTKGKHLGKMQKSILPTRASSKQTHPSHLTEAACSSAYVACGTRCSGAYVGGEPLKFSLPTSRLELGTAFLHTIHPTAGPSRLECNFAVHLNYILQKAIKASSV